MEKLCLPVTHPVVSLGCCAAGQAMPRGEEGRGGSPSSSGRGREVLGESGEPICLLVFCLCGLVYEMHGFLPGNLLLGRRADPEMVAGWRMRLQQGIGVCRGWGRSLPGFLGETYWKSSAGPSMVWPLIQKCVDRNKGLGEEKTRL